MENISKVEEMMKTQLVNRFNALICEFLQKLIETYPHNEIGLKTMSNSIQLAILVSPSIIFSEFHSSVTPAMRSLINKRDASLFQMPEVKANKTLSSMCIDENWAITPGDTREVIWSYLEALIGLTTVLDTLQFTNGQMADLETKIKTTVDGITKEYKNKGGVIEKENLPEVVEKMANGLGIDYTEVKKAITQLDTSTLDEELAAVFELLTEQLTI